MATRLTCYNSKHSTQGTVYLSELKRNCYIYSQITLQNSVTTSSFVNLPLLSWPRDCELYLKSYGTTSTGSCLGNGWIHLGMERTSTIQNLREIIENFPRQLATMINMGRQKNWIALCSSMPSFTPTALVMVLLNKSVLPLMMSECCAMKLPIGLRPTSHTQTSLRSAFELRRHLIKSLNLPTIPLQIIREKVHFSSGSTKELVSLQFIEGKSCLYLTSF